MIFTIRFDRIVLQDKLFQKVAAQSPLSFEFGLLTYWTLEMTMQFALIIVSIFSLVGVRFIPRAGKSRYLWYPVCIVNILITILFSWQNYTKGRQMAMLNSTVAALRDYSDMAELDFTGSPYSYGGVIRYDSELTRLIDGTYTITNGRCHIIEGNTSEERFRSVIEKYPRFPFAYYGLAFCLSRRGDPSWRDYANQAASILEKTTIISGHKSNHDEILKELREILKKPNNASDGIGAERAKSAR